MKSPFVTNQFIRCFLGKERHLLTVLFEFSVQCASRGHSEVRQGAWRHITHPLVGSSAYLKNDRGRFLTGGGNLKEY